MRYMVVFLVFCLTNVTSNRHNHGQGNNIKNDTKDELEPPQTSVMDIIINANKESGILKNLQEGDIIKSSSRKKRNAIRVGIWKWEKNIIPYVIEKNGISNEGVAAIRSAINKYNQVQSCVKWIPWTTEDDYVIIRNGDGCYSSIGRDSGPQNLVLGSSCYYEGVILHEMNHAVGFFHEQSRYDRDDYIFVNWENVQDDKTRDFTKQQRNIMDTLGTVYDYGSIMHYSATTFSKNGRPTLVAKYNTQGTMGQRFGLSEMDIWKIEKLYGCVSGDPPLPKWKQLAQATTTLSQSTMKTDGLTPSIPGHVTHTHTPSSVSYSQMTSTKTPSSPSTTSSTTTATTTATTTTTTTKKPCPEEVNLPNGIPGRVQDFQVVLIENTLRVFWTPPCTTVQLTGYRLTVKNGQQHSTITIAPNRQSHYIYTANHPGTRYEMTVTALSPYGSGATSPAISTVSACGHDIVLPPNGKIGSVHSPYFLSEYYEPDVACLWNVKASKGQRLKIKFDAINLSDNSGSCTYDYVMINSVRFCRAAPKGGYYITVDRDAKIIFRSAPGNAVKHGGFNFSIEAIDTQPKVKQVINKSGVIGLKWESPANTKNTSYGHILKYRIIPEVNQEVIRLAPGLHEFVFPTGNNIGRQYEIELSTVTSQEEGRPVKYTVRSACGHNVTVNSTGRIQNPQLSGHYQPDVVCIWHFNSYQLHGYRLRVLTLGVETSPNCEHDFLSINSQKYCDSSQISQLTPVYNDSVKVVFQSNGSIQKNGFIMQYEMV